MTNLRAPKTFHAMERNTSRFPCDVYQAGSMGKSGFSLIEVMMALAILGIGLTVLLTAASRGVAVAAKAKEYEVARTLIYQVELENPLQLDDLDEGSESGRFEGKYTKYRWEREIVEFGEESDELFKISTTVIWKSRKGDLREGVETLIHLPSALKGGFVDEQASL